MQLILQSAPRGFFSVLYQLCKMTSKHMLPEDFDKVTLNSVKDMLLEDGVALPMTLDQTREIASVLIEHGSPDLAGIAHTLAVILVAKGEDPSSSFIKSLMSKKPDLKGKPGVAFIDLMAAIVTTDEYNACSTKPNPTCPEPVWGEIKRIPTDEH